MITLCTRLFSEPASALGALYAFEAQQPRIAISKLQGIKDYYPLPEMAVSYFKVHSQNAQEVDKIRISINELPKEEKSVVINSCELMCEFCGMPYRVFLRIRRTSNRF